MRSVLLRLKKESNFNPRSPRGGATFWKGKKENGKEISIHAPHEGERRPQLLLHRGWDYGISIHAPHEGERPWEAVDMPSGGGISIHAPHEGERLHRVFRRSACKSISIHAPHEGERLRPKIIYKIVVVFQSTLPTRGSDVFVLLYCSKYTGYFNPRSPRGGATGR